MIFWIVIGCLLVGLVIVGIRKERMKVVPENQVENEMPVHWRYSDKAVMTVYVYLAGWLIRKNHRKSIEKQQFVSDYFKLKFSHSHYDPKVEMERALRYPVHIRSIANWVNRRMKKAADRRQLMDFLIALAFADGDLTQMEYVALARFGELTGVQLSYIEAEVNKRKMQLYGEYVFDPTIDLLANRSRKRRHALSTLGLIDPVNETEIRSCYRKLAKQYHPDKLQHLSGEEQENAALKFLQVREAYEWLLNEI